VESRGIVVKSFLLLFLFVTPFCWAQIPHYNILISPAVVESLRTRDTFSDDYLPAQFRCSDTLWKDVKIRYKGHSTRYFSKKPFRVRFQKKHLFNGVEDIDVNSMYTDRSFIREKLAWDLFEEMGELAPRAHYADLSLNGKPQGLYLVVDKVDKYFLQNRGRTISSVYDAGAYYSLADMTVQNKQMLPLYYPKAVGDKDDYDDLFDLFTALNAAPDSTFPAVADSLFDMNSVYNWFAGNILMMMGDSYNKNFLLYRDDSRRLHQWIVIPWDYDISFGTSGDFAVPYPQSLLNRGFSYTFPPLSGPTNIMKERMMRSEPMREHLRLRVDTLLNTVFTNAHFDPFIDSMASMIKTDVAADSQKQGTYQDFLDGIEALKYFITVRRNFLLKTYIHPQPGIFDMVVLKEFRLNDPTYCVGFDGRQFATLWFEKVKGLDSILIEAHPDSISPGFDTMLTPKFVRRWLRIIPFPGSAKFTMKLQWSYHDISSTEREVSSAVNDERALQCFYRRNDEWQPLSGRINPVANTVMIDSVTDHACGSHNCFMLFVPSE
jgi:spore coat protein H